MLNWSDDIETRFGKEITQAKHTIHNNPMFDDAGLAELLDVYPREHLGTYAFPDHGQGRLEPMQGCAEGVSGADLLDVVKRGKVWLNLRAAHNHVEDLHTLCHRMFDGLEARVGKKIFKRDVGVLISSPHVHVQYHLDIPLVLLVQLRGTKRLWVYPAGAPFAEPQHVEAIALREREEELPFDESFESDGQCIELNPGDAITWPQTAPHRVQNADMLNVSLSCEFMTMAGLIRANAIHANGVLRREMGVSSGLPDRIGPTVLTKAALSRAIKVVRPVPPHAPKRPVFRIDPAAENGVASL